MVQWVILIQSNENERQLPSTARVVQWVILFQSNKNENERQLPAQNGSSVFSQTYDDAIYLVCNVPYQTENDRVAEQIKLIAIIWSCFG